MCLVQVCLVQPKLGNQAVRKTTTVIRQYKKRNLKEIDFTREEIQGQSLTIQKMPGVPIINYREVCIVSNQSTSYTHLVCGEGSVHVHVYCKWTLVTVSFVGCSISIVIKEYYTVQY